MDKFCSKCNEVKPEMAYFKYKKSKDGLQVNCKICTYKNLKQWRKKNPDKVKKIAKTFRTQNENGYYNSFYKSKYKISFDYYNELVKKQDSKCKICGIDQSELDRRLAVDHCHETGKVRGLLCGNCNKGIGNLQESVMILESAITYLKETL